ncbi:Protein FAR1-RELATED SEQUENCE 5-like [Oopsacas minuta]|uniref:Protein FAR1-RELATED SEQUENCE 5-like n=1 Tax=Oopsacas minuta TaxID=111878 RepID=A0AAV7K7W8_9METZ|nr:Protein FAR1-RELATED SEQUENCE 5-like [Oopsacas minuta]
MAEPSDQSDEYFAAIASQNYFLDFNSCSLTGYNEIEHPTEMIDYPNYLHDYDPDHHTDAFGPISSTESQYIISKFPDPIDTNSPPNECSQVDPEQVFENQSVSGSITHTDVRRRIDTMILSRSAILPYDMPKGPWESHVTSKLDINEWAKFAHNHDLVESHSASLVESSLRQIPFEFTTLGFELKRAGLTASKINQVFISKAHEKHLPITWSYQDVYNKFQPSVEERSFDATNFVSYLQEQLSTKGLYFAIQTAEDSSMSKVFWTLTDSFERWVENSEANIVLFDTTHGTNKYTLKFAAFCTVNKHVNTPVLACTLLDRETEEAFTWAFSEFLKPFRHPPKIIITDCDPAMAAAIRNVHPSTIHLLCTFHIGQNIVKHIKPLFSGRHENLCESWNAFLNSWWNLCKKQDSESRDDFDQEWKELLALVQSRQNSNNEKVSILLNFSYVYYMTREFNGHHDGPGNTSRWVLIPLNDQTVFKMHILFLHISRIKLMKIGRPFQNKMKDVQPG